MSEVELKFRREIYRSDLEHIIRWLDDKAVAEYLNEDQNVQDHLRRAVQESTLPIFSPQLNRDGIFFMLTLPDRGPIGFLRLITKGDSAEIVIVIGERSEWGKGYGFRAVRQGIRHAFFNWRKKRMIAKIDRQNERSKRIFRKAGLKKTAELQNEDKYVLHVNEVISNSVRV